jgi:phthalate 4,5-cis-dihydrodiol dehydrogenase
MTPEATSSPATRPIGLGIAGLGMAGAVMVHAAAAHPDFVLRAAAERHVGPREAFARDFRARTYDDVVGLCDDPSVDVVYIATPHQFHAEHAVAAAERGKHIILEKPMALSLAECDAIIAAVERHGVHLIVGHTHAFDPTVRLMRRMIANGELGRLGMITAWNYTNFLYRPRRPEELDTARGGGILFNQVPHQIDTVRLLAGGCVRSARANVQVLDPARPTEGGCVAWLEFESGAAASLVYSGYDYFDSDEWHGGIGERGAPKQLSHGAARRSLASATADETRLRTETFAYGAKPPPMPDHQPHFGIMVATCQRGDLRPYADGVMLYDQNGMREIPIAKGTGMPGRREVLDDMAGAIRTGTPPLHDGRWGKATLEVALAMLRSAREGREVRLEHQVAVPKGW